VPLRSKLNPKRKTPKPNKIRKTDSKLNNTRYIALLWLAWLLTAANVANAQQPNIVLIMCDDVGYSDLGCYGGEIETPNLDRLAEHGLRFTQFYNTGRCCSTRAALLTGIYAHQAGIGHMVDGVGPKSGFPSYSGELSKNAVTIAEVLKSAGYSTYMAGKWHVTGVTKPDAAYDQHNWPLQRGFDRFYGTIHGAGSFFDPNSLTRDNNYISPYSDAEYQPEQYYYTNAINDQASRFVREHAKSNPTKPFFLYMAHTAAHWPMHAKENDIARYKGKYDSGYDPIRTARLTKMKQLGLLDDAWQISPQVGDWSKVEDKAWESRCMEVYAAMITCMDSGIGQFIEVLKANGQYENTLILFLQDNGGCAEGMGRGANGKPRAENATLEPLSKDYLQPDMIPKQTRDGFPVRQGKGVMPGGPDTYIGYGQNWANVSNTPFREYKHWQHEGGISTPLIAHWPSGISQSQNGKLNATPSHLIDVMATCADIGGAKYPTVHHGKNIQPLEGVSLANAFQGESIDRQKPIFWEHEGNRAVRLERWKLVSKHPQGWELYDVVSDRTEMKNLASEQPQRVNEMSKMWDDWAARVGVQPWPLKQK
jgi:arylsulfatase A-like enzyme